MWGTGLTPRLTGEAGLRPEPSRPQSSEECWGPVSESAWRSHKGGGPRAAGVTCQAGGTGRPAPPSMLVPSLGVTSPPQGYAQLKAKDRQPTLRQKCQVPVQQQTHGVLLSPAPPVPATPMVPTHNTLCDRTCARVSPFPSSSYSGQRTYKTKPDAVGSPICPALSVCQRNVPLVGSETLRPRQGGRKC